MPETSPSAVRDCLLREVTGSANSRHLFSLCERGLWGRQNNSTITSFPRFLSNFHSGLFLSEVHSNMFLNCCLNPLKNKCHLPPSLSLLLSFFPSLCPSVPLSPGINTHTHAHLCSRWKKTPKISKTY